MNNLMTTIAFFIVTSFACFAQESVTLTVTIPNATSDNGKMLIAIYDEVTFMKAAPVFATSVAITNGVATATFENVPVGEYAVNVMHDKNENGRMDFENGMPAESYGMSNNPMSFGPPKWDEARFLLKENTEMNIRL